MSKMKKIMEDLHKELAEKLLATVRDPESRASELNVVRQFLKDNAINAVPVDDSVMRRILSELPFDEDLNSVQ
tara:strand:+ start:578 stop:796 length:219 start_codon:yes stop_codon:yes gene_type:complete